MAADTLNLDLRSARARSRGILVGILMVLVAFSICWYLFVPVSALNLVEADTTEAESIVQIDPFYVLLIGSDSRKGTALYTGNAWEEGQTEISSDVLTLVRIDAPNRQLTFLTIPRDTLSVGSSVKIGSWLEDENILRTIVEVEKLTGADISNYMLVNFTGFENLVDAIGGVEVNVPIDVSIFNPLNGAEVRVSAGPNQLLNGAQALAVASAGEYSEELEALRQTSVRALEQGILHAAQERDEETIRRLITVLYSNVETNMDDSVLVSLVLDYVENWEQYTIYFGSGPYQGSTNNKGEWVVARDSATWARCMEVVDKGGDPNTVVVSFASG